MARLQRKRGRKSNYSKSLNNEYWREVRRCALLNANFKCQFPGCNEILRLEVHHEIYQINGESIFGKELDHMNCIKVLCEKHHKKGTFKI